MDLLQLLILLIIVGICAAIAEWIVGYTLGGLLLTLIVGVIGAYSGSWLPSPWPISFMTIQVGSGLQTVTFNLIWTIVGSIALLLLLHMMRGGERRRLFGGRL